MNEADLLVEALKRVRDPAYLEFKGIPLESRKTSVYLDGVRVTLERISEEERQNDLSSVQGGV